MSVYDDEKNRNKCDHVKWNVSYVRCLFDGLHFFLVEKMMLMYPSDKPPRGNVEMC